MRDTIAAYLEHLAAQRKSSASLHAYSDRLKLFRLFAHGKQVHAIRNVTVNLVRQFHDDLINRELKPASQKAYMMTVCLFLRWAHQHGLTLTDLSARIDLPEEPKTLPPTPLTEEDMRTLFECLPMQTLSDIRNRAIIEVIYGCGLRRQEVLALNVGDIDAARGVVTIKGKGDKERQVPIHDEALRSISAYLSARGGKPNRNSPLFLTHNWTKQKPHRMNTVGLDKVFSKVNRSFPKHVHPHLLRHTFALHLLQNGVDVRHVQTLLGHESPDTTSRYLRLCKAEIKRLFDLGIDTILSME